MSDSEEEEPPTKKTKGTSLPTCPYAENCYRKNPQHFKEFSHPGGSSKPGKDNVLPKKSTKSKPATETKNSSTTAAAAESKSLPPCEYGAKCYRKNLLHFAEFSHPTSGATAAATADSGSDTDPMESDEEKEVDKGDKVDSTGLLKRGVSLVKKYSQMTEVERKELIKKAMEMKEELQKELKETKKQVAEKDKELNRLQEQVNTGMLLVEGEKEALEGDTIKYFQLMPERQYKEGSANQVHFRLAESQFYRLLSGAYSNQYRVAKVEYVVNPPLVKKFNKSRENMKKTRGKEFSYPILAFHGTEEKNILPICKTGFRVPGTDDPKLKHRMNNEGLFGKGIYFSEFTHYSLGYVAGSNQILLSQVLPGKVYHCPGMALGKPLTEGYDSHMSPCKKELVIYHSERILPCYVVHYKNTSQEFKYVKPPEERRKISKQDELMKIYWKAKKAKKTKSLAGFHIRLSGKLCDTEDELGKLIVKHGGYFVATPPPPKKPAAKKWGGGIGLFGATAHQNFNILITTETEFKKQTFPVFTQATTNKAQILRQEFLYDSIIEKTKVDPENYDLEDV